MKHMRKLSLLLCVALLASMVLTGCGPKEKPAPPNEAAEAIFMIAIKNDAAKAMEVFGFASESDAKKELMGSDEDPYKEVGEELVSQFEALGATVSSEDAQVLIDAVLSMLGKLQYSAEVKDMDEKAGTVTVLRETEYGEETVEAKLPVLMTIEKTNYQPRIPNFKGKKFARTFEITKLTSDTIEGLDKNKIGAPGSGTIVPRTYPPEKTASGVMIDEGDDKKNVAKVMEILADKGLV